MDNSHRSNAPSDDSYSMYLSFDTDADDTLASKWRSVMATQTSHYLEMQSMEVDLKQDDTLEDTDLKSSVLDNMIKNDGCKDQVSPLRPFDKSILNKHNALCSTPTKILRMNIVANDAENKENSQPDEQNSTLSSTIDATASTVKTNTMFPEANASLDDISMKEHNKTNNVYPLSADVVLENITEVSNEELSISTPSPLADKMTAVAKVADMVTEQNPTTMPAPSKDKIKADAVVPCIVIEDSPKSVSAPFEEKVKTNPGVDMVNEVSDLIAKAMQLSEQSKKPKGPQKILPKLPANGFPRPRRSYLPTASGSSFKQRMSIVVKTTLNSPARKLAAGNPIARRSCLPAQKANPIGGTTYRKSTMVRSSLSASSSTCTLRSMSAAGGTAVKACQTQAVPFQCKLCSATFCMKKLLDKHMDTHWKNNPARNKASASCCKYCDKKFVLERALHIHLMENCTKIPPGDKRKLQFTELNHVQKAKLPKMISGSDGSKPRDSIMPPIKKESSMIGQTIGRKPIVTTLAASFIPNNEGAGTLTMTKSEPMAPPSIKKIPKKVAHSGVFRTPTKTVPCHICKMSFKSILDYTTHSLTVHSKNRKQDTASALSAPNQD